jgi:hypothetical protein
MASRAFHDAVGARPVEVAPVERLNVLPEERDPHGPDLGGVHARELLLAEPGRRCDPIEPAREGLPGRSDRRRGNRQGARRRQRDKQDGPAQTATARPAPARRAVPPNGPRIPSHEAADLSPEVPPLATDAVRRGAGAPVLGGSQSRSHGGQERPLRTCETDRLRASNELREGAGKWR